MSNMVIPILLTIFAFGAVAGYINETGLYSGHYTIPTTNTNLSQGSVTEMHDTAERAADSNMVTTGLVYVEWIVIGLKSVGAGILALFTLGPLLESFGMPMGMAGMFLSPMAFVAMMYLISYITGRESE
jgi:hypothetical protein